jgi:16S rRNA (uracil1498-N3)-methyltransferase
MRRLHVEQVRAGEIELGKQEAHHARDVLRLQTGTEVEIFDDHGYSATAAIERCDRHAVTVRTLTMNQREMPKFRWSIASAIPKGTRGDWMIEKISELGAFRFIPLKAARSVVLPEGKGKHERWQRLATEAARQSKRSGVMQIEPLTDPAILLPTREESAKARAWYLSTAQDARPMAAAIEGMIGHRPHPFHLTLFIGPEGGWTEGEIGEFEAAHLTPVRMGTTILRVETAAVAAAAIVAAILAPNLNAAAPESA